MKEGNGNGVVTFKWITGLTLTVIIGASSIIFSSFATQLDEKADKEVVTGEIRRLDASDTNIKEDIVEIKSDLKEMKRDQKEMIKMLTRIDARTRPK